MTDTDHRYLFKLPVNTFHPAEQPIRRLKYPIWTRNKARLIQRYLFYFLMITKHGTYIDGLAGPQESDYPDTWAAKLVLELEPRWLRNFFLFELKKKGYEDLCALRDAQPPRDMAKREPERSVEVFFGDFNKLVGEVLPPGRIPDKEAAFCLLDQRTFECSWTTVSAIANHKTAGNRIELFYFLPNSWLDRAVSALKDPRPVLSNWWGRDDWESAILAKNGQERAELFTDRMRSELGYSSVKAWPIWERPGGGNIMYYMIHATDHPEAPYLMYRAYHKAVDSWEPVEQLQIKFAELRENA